MNSIQYEIYNATKNIYIKLHIFAFNKELYYQSIALMILYYSAIH